MKLRRILICVIFFSCNHTISNPRKEKLWLMIKSNNVDSIIDATLEIQEARDTSMISALLYKVDDPRVTNSLPYKGRSIYQAKMVALKIVTGISPPKVVTYEVDTTIINFYKFRLLK